MSRHCDHRDSGGCQVMHRDACRHNCWDEDRDRQQQRMNGRHVCEDNEVSSAGEKPTRSSRLRRNRERDWSRNRDRERDRIKDSDSSDSESDKCWTENEKTTTVKTIDSDESFTPSPPCRLKMHDQHS